MQKIGFLFILFVFVSCEKNSLEKDIATENTCGVKRPTRDLPWLKERIHSSERLAGRLRVFQGNYEGETVFTMDIFVGPDGNPTSTYRCDGALLCSVSYTVAGPIGDCPKLPSKITNNVLIYDSGE